MDQQDLKSLFKGARPHFGDVTPFCGTNDEIASYVDGNLQSADHMRIERHLAECDVCADRVGQAVRLLRDVDDSARPSDQAMAGARRFGIRPGDRYPKRWAAAAVILLAVFLVSERVSEIENGGWMDPGATRNVSNVAMSLQLLSPGPGMIVDADELIFSWDAIDESLYYDIRIVTDSGGLVTEQRVQQTEWPLSSNIDLAPDTDYFVRIDAVLPNARTVSSDHVRFRVSGGN